MINLLIMLSTIFIIFIVACIVIYGIKDAYKNPDINNEHHFVATACRDKSGRMRYYIYLDGKLCKKEIIYTKWIKLEE